MVAAVYPVTPVMSAFGVIKITSVLATPVAVVVDGVSQAVEAMAAVFKALVPEAMV